MSGGFTDREHLEALGWTPEAKALVARRGWTELAIERLGLGWNPTEGRVVIPVTDETGDLLGELRYDPTGEREPKMLAANGVPRVLFPAPELIGDDEPPERTAFLLEGEGDGIAAWSVGLVAVAVPGAGNWNDDWAARLVGRGWKVAVCFDCDKPGRTNARRAAAAIVRAGGDARLLDLDPARNDGYDLTDFLLEHDVNALRARLEQVPMYDVPVADATPASSAVARVRLTRIADVEPKRIVWLDDEGLIACDVLTGLVAPGGTVKGLYGIHQAAKLAARGERTIFVCSEDALDYIVRPRFEAAGCDGKLAYALSVETDTGERVPHFPSDLPLLKAAIVDVQPRLVVIDPIASYIDPGLDMGKNNEMRLILQPLVELARDVHVALLVVYHLGKQRERGALGTVAFEDACRQVLTAARDDDDEDVRHVELTKSNIGPTGYGRRMRIVGVPLTIDGEVVEVAKLVDDGPSWKSVHALLARKQSPGPDPEKRKIARDLLVEALVAGGTEGVNAEEAKRVVADKAGVSAQTVWRAFAELKADELATGAAIRDEFGSILEWRWTAKLALLVGRNDV